MTELAERILKRIDENVHNRITREITRVEIDMRLRAITDALKFPYFTDDERFELLNVYKDLLEQRRTTNIANGAEDGDGNESE